MLMLLSVISKHKVKMLISFVSAIQTRLRNLFLFFLCLNQNTCCGYLRNELNFLKCSWNHEKGLTLTLQETRNIHDSMNRSKIEYCLYLHFIMIYKKNFLI